MPATARPVRNEELEPDEELNAAASLSVLDGRTRLERDRRLGAELKELRKFVGLSQMEVAVLCRVHITTVSRWERGLHQHTHRSKDRGIRSTLEALKWAAELQREEPDHAFSLADISAYVERRSQERRMTAEYRRRTRARKRAS